MRKQIYLYIGLITVFISAFFLFFIFNSIGNLLTNCKEDPQFSPACGQLSGFTVTVLVVFLIIGGFVVTITATSYILLSAA